MQRSIHQILMMIRHSQRNTYFQRRMHSNNNDNNIMSNSCKLIQRHHHHNQHRHYYKQSYQHIEKRSIDNHSYLVLLGVFQMGIMFHSILNEKHSFCEEVVLNDRHEQQQQQQQQQQRQQQQQQEQQELKFHNYYYQKINNQNTIDNDDFWNESHAVFGALMKEGLIERYNMYKVIPMITLEQTKNHEDGNNNNDETKLTINHEILLASVRIGKGLNGHKGIVHGGIISLLFDETFGWSFEAMPSAAADVSGRSNESDSTVVVTANLNINYRHPLPAETDVVIRVYLDKVVGRKIYLSARMESRNGQLLYCDSTVLFVRIKKSALNKR